MISNIHELFTLLEPPLPSRPVSNAALWRLSAHGNRAESLIFGYFAAMRYFFPVSGIYRARALEKRSFRERRPTGRGVLGGGPPCLRGPGRPLPLPRLRAVPELCQGFRRGRRRGAGGAGRRLPKAGKSARAAKIRPLVADHRRQPVPHVAPAPTPTGRLRRRKGGRRSRPVAGGASAFARAPAEDYGRCLSAEPAATTGRGPFLSRGPLTQADRRLPRRCGTYHRAAALPGAPPPKRGDDNYGQGKPARTPPARGLHAGSSARGAGLGPAPVTGAPVARSLQSLQPHRRRRAGPPSKPTTVWPWPSTAKPARL